MIRIAFLYPKLLLALFLVPLFLFIYFSSVIYNKKKSILFPNFEAMRRISDIEFFSKNLFSLYINLIILCCLVFALAGASISYTAESSSFDYVIAIDTSDSMRTSDIYPDRITAAKEAAKKFVDGLPAGVEVGVITFAGDAKIIHELDNTKITTKIAIDSVDYSEVHGTNMYNALVAADRVFGDRKMKSVILISDGQLNVGETTQVINYAARNNIIVNSIMVGTREGGISVYDTISKVDEDILKSISFNSGGKFFEATDLTTFDNSFSDILNETDKEISLSISFYLISLSLIFLLVDWIIINYRFRVIP